jgi:hypothetical protein
MWWIRWGRGNDWTGWFCGRDMGYFRECLGGFAVAALGEFQQLVEGFWVGYLVDGFVVQNPC